MRLYTFFLSSAAYRVRIGLALKGLSPEQHAVHLGRNQQADASYLALNPQGLVPLLVDDDFVLSQSLAILEYLEETVPEPPLLPRDARGRARVRSLAYVIACDVHPLQNLGPRQYLAREMRHSEAEVLAWSRHWITRGLGALEALVADHPRTGRFCHGDTPTLADVCLVPQLANAERYGCFDAAAWPTLARIRDACNALAAFQAASPARQPDASG
jgi:maleylacetoacetate isomerase